MGKVENAKQFNPMENMRKRIASQGMLIDALTGYLSSALDEIGKLQKANTVTPVNKTVAPVLQLVKK